MPEANVTTPGAAAPADRFDLRATDARTSLSPDAGTPLVFCSCPTQWGAACMAEE